MNRIAQGLVSVLLGAAVLGSAFSGLYLNYVKALFQPFLILTGIILVGLGVWVVLADLRASAHEAGTDAEHGTHDSHGHDHSRAPRVAWLLVLPVISVFVIAPPALGSYSAAETTATSPGDARDSSSFDELDDSSGPIEMKLQEFVMRAWTDEDREMAGREIELTGFAAPNSEGEGWYLVRLQMACCAADAVVNRVLITDEPEPEKDSWWRVRGTWVEPDGDLEDVQDHRFAVDEMTEVDNPPDPYE